MRVLAEKPGSLSRPAVAVLSSLLVQTLTILAKSMTTSASLALPRWDVASRRACAVVVMHPIRSGLLLFVNRIECCNARHSMSFRAPIGALA